MKDTCLLELRDIVLGEETDEPKASSVSLLRGYGFKNIGLACKNLKAHHLSSQADDLCQ